MAQYTSIAPQTVPVGGNVTFENEAVRATPAVLHRAGSGVFTLRGCTEQCRALYRVSFGANIAVPTGETVGPISAAISLAGEALGSSTAIVTPAAVEDYWNIYVSDIIPVPRGCCVTVGVRNTSDIPINVQNASLIVERIA